MRGDPTSSTPAWHEIRSRWLLGELGVNLDRSIAWQERATRRSGLLMLLGTLPKVRSSTLTKTYHLINRTTF
jgi:hypothetical protein